MIIVQKKMDDTPSRGARTTHDPTTWMIIVQKKIPKTLSGVRLRITLIREFGFQLLPPRIYSGGGRKSRLVTGSLKFNF